MDNLTVQLIKFLRSATPSYLLKKIETYQKFPDKFFSSKVSYQFASDETLSISFEKNDNPKIDFKKHKKNLQKENRCKLVIQTTNWQQNITGTYSFFCTLEELGENFFRIKIYEGKYK
ncbi:MAG: hypothetical protein WA101_02485 [Minisyncoccia bacterium]